MFWYISEKNIHGGWQTSCKHIQTSHLALMKIEQTICLSIHTQCWRWSRVESYKSCSVVFYGCFFHNGSIVSFSSVTTVSGTFMTWNVTSVMYINNITLQIKIIDWLPYLRDVGMGSIEPLFHWSKTHLNPLRSGFCVQYECVHSAFTPISTDSAVDAVFFHLIPVHCYESWSVVFRSQKSLTCQLWKYLDHQPSRLPV